MTWLLPFILQQQCRKTAGNSLGDHFICFTELPWILRYCNNPMKSLSSCLPACLELRDRVRPTQPTPHGPPDSGAPLDTVHL